MIRTKSCLQCEKIFEKPYNESVKAWETRHKFCGRSCSAKYHANLPEKVATRFKKGFVSRTAIKKGEHRGEATQFKKGHKTWHAGTKGLVTAWNKGIPHAKVRGERHWNWKGGTTKLRAKIRGSIEYKLWRDTVLERDHHKCVLCGSVDKICVDHITPFSEMVRSNNVQSLEEALLCTELFSAENGRVLCNGCHEQTETYFRKQHIRLSKLNMYDNKKGKNSSKGKGKGGKKC